MTDCGKRKKRGREEKRKLFLALSVHVGPVYRQG